MYWIEQRSESVNPFDAKICVNGKRLVVRSEDLVNVFVFTQRFMGVHRTRRSSILRFVSGIVRFDTKRVSTDLTERRGK